ncbi:hypothetical protein SOM61_19660 [Massilia sp. CFBP9012]|uniref:hypothetical protein n=1 Tax=Massilia sp. CFBP9012 TaxID=3096531 RepID=UPI002A69E14E|nr:hypothetical protein [Massilia sp. CFBP9012]MDY0977187.1 hypothetical protein [Massilia sp. CFBP9012]
MLAITAPRQPLLLAASLVLAGAIALTIHVAMLAAGIPFPLSQPPAWARWLNLSLAIGAVFVVLRLAGPDFARRGFQARTLIVFALLLTIRETARAGIMSGVVTTGWAYSAIGLIEPVAKVLIQSVLCVAAVRWVRGGVSLVVVALATAALCMGGQALAGMALAPLMEQFASFARPAQYVFPYPFHVTLAAYLTMLEPVIGATLVLALVWQRLPGTKIARLLTAALLVALLKGIVGVTFVFSFFMKQPPLEGMLSYSQFLFEFLALGFLAALAWDAFGPAVKAQTRAPSSLS